MNSKINHLILRYNMAEIIQILQDKDFYILWSAWKQNEFETELKETEKKNTIGKRNNLKINLPT